MVPAVVIVAAVVTGVVVITTVVETVVVVAIGVKQALIAALITKFVSPLVVVSGTIFMAEMLITGVNVIS